MGASSRQAGFTYLGLMFIVVALGLALVATSQVWVTVVKRDKEAELLFVGSQFRRALGQYVKDKAGEAGPRSLDDLVKDSSSLTTKRYLRKVFVDPMTGKAEWGLRKDKDGRILGIYSLSEAEPLKVANFAEADKEFEGKKRYSDWVFTARIDGAKNRAGGAAAGATRAQASGLAGTANPQPAGGSAAANGGGVLQGFGSR